MQNQGLIGIIPGEGAAFQSGDVDRGAVRGWVEAPWTCGGNL